MKRCPICNTKIIMQDSARCSSCEAEKLRRELQVAQLAHFSTTNKKVEAEERYAEMAIECNVMLTEIADLRAKLQTAEQQLGQAQEEIKRLENLVSLREAHLTDDRIAFDKQLGQVREVNNKLHWALESQSCTCLDGDPCVRCVGLSEWKVDLTPSDGCGKGDTLSSRLPDKQGLWWWQSDGESAPVAVHIAFSGCGGDYFATIGQYGWTEPQSVKDMGGLWLRAVEPRMVPFHEFTEAASSKGKEGGR